MKKKPRYPKYVICQTKNRRTDIFSAENCVSMQRFSKDFFLKKSVDDHHSLQIHWLYYL